MDVTGWDIASRMKLPDWCFGARSTDGVYLPCDEATTKYWGISTLVLPDPVCIWSVGWFSRQKSSSHLEIRAGLRATVPTSEAEMDEAVEILPGVGEPMTGPDKIKTITPYSLGTFFHLRKGIVTTGLKLVLQALSSSDAAPLSFFMVYSALPTKVPGWPGAWPAG